MSDWSATMNTLSAVAGLDMTMPGDITFDSGTSFFGGNLTAYVANDTISMARLDDMATRIIAAWYFLHQDQGYPNTTINSWNPYDPINQEVNAQSNHYELVRQIGAAGTVLLKNEGVLPLNKPKSIVLVGSDAAPPNAGPNEYPDQGGDPTGILAMGWGSGTDNFTYLISVISMIGTSPKLGTLSSTWKLRSCSSIRIRVSNTSLLTATGDRKNLTAWHQGDDLILAVAAENNNTIVVTNSVGPLILEPWVEHPNVTVIVWANLGGNEAGNAITDILYGAWNPSGRLPYTIAKSPSDYPTQLVLGGTADDILSINYTEGLFIDYRWYCSTLMMKA